MPGPRDNRGSKSGNSRGPKGPAKGAPKRAGAKSFGGKSPGPKTGAPKFGKTKPFGAKSFSPKPFGAKPFRAKPEGRDDDRPQRSTGKPASKGAFWEKAPSPYKKGVDGKGEVETSRDRRAFARASGAPKRSNRNFDGPPPRFREGDDDRPRAAKTFGAKPYAGKSAGPKKFGDKPFAKKSFGDKPYGKPAGKPFVGGDKPFRSRRDDDQAEARPRTFRPKPQDDGDRPYSKPPRRNFDGPPSRQGRGFDGPPPGRDYGDKPAGDRPARTSKPFGARPPSRGFDGPPPRARSGGDERPRFSRDDERPRPPRRDYGDRPAGDRPPRTSKPFGARPPSRNFDGPPARVRSGDRPEGDDRPRFSRDDERPRAPRRDFDAKPSGDRPVRPPRDAKPFAAKSFGAPPRDRKDDDARPRFAKTVDTTDDRPRRSFSKPPISDEDADGTPVTKTTRRPDSPRPSLQTGAPRQTQSRGPVRHDTAANVSPARRVAFEVLRQVEQGAHSTDLLRERTGYLDPRDRGLATELVLGTLRRRPQLDYLIRHFSDRDPTLTTEVRIALQLGIYQLRYLERIPTFAAVDETVEIVRALGEIPASGFVNAVLRRVTRDAVRWPDRATELCVPTWMLRRWDAQFGKKATTAMGEAFLAVPETYIRVPSGAEPPPNVEATEVRGAYRVMDGADPSGFRIQDIGSQSIVPMLKLEPGQSFLDIASAPGGKFLQAMETPNLRGIAADGSLKRLREIAVETRVVADATRPLPFSQKFDRILLDAPCSGTGTIGRNPEIRWRTQPGDLVRHHERQVKMLSEALKLLAPDGVIVYSTCSLEPEENEDVIKRVMNDFSGRAKLQHTTRRTPGTDPGDGFYASVLKSIS